MKEEVRIQNLRKRDTKESSHKDTKKWREIEDLAAYYRLFLMNIAKVASESWKLTALFQGFVSSIYNSALVFSVIINDNPGVKVFYINSYLWNKNNTNIPLVKA